MSETTKAWLSKAWLKGALNGGIAAAAGSTVTAEIAVALEKPRLLRDDFKRHSIREAPWSFVECMLFADIVDCIAAATDAQPRNRAHTPYRLEFLFR